MHDIICIDKISFVSFSINISQNGWILAIFSYIFYLNIFSLTDIKLMYLLSSDIFPTPVKRDCKCIIMSFLLAIIKYKIL